jgi:hypothetical protein
MPDNAGNQVQRIVARFALLAVAGEMATLQGITGWQEGTAYEAVQICLHAWLNERGHIANQEDEGVLAQIKRFITSHQYSRFASLLRKPVPTRTGWYSVSYRRSLSLLSRRPAHHAEPSPAIPQLSPSGAPILFSAAQLSLPHASPLTGKYCYHIGRRSQHVTTGAGHFSTYPTVR